MTAHNSDVLLQICSAPNGSSIGMSLRCFATCCLVVVATVSLSRADEKDDELAIEYPVLARLTPPKDKLPPNCKIQEIPADVRELEHLENLAITVDSKLFLIGDARLEKLIDKKTINAAYFGLYREKNDCGVIGWAFSNVENAQKAHKAMAESYSNEKERFRLWQFNEYVVWLWRDPGTTDECFESFERYVSSQLKKPVKPDGENAT